MRRTDRPVLLAGLAVIAVTYGFGRYAYGLFVPRFAEALALSSTALGVVGGLSHMGYGVGLVAAPRCVRRLGPRAVAAGAAAASAVGLAAVAGSVGAVTLGAAVAVAGLGSGLASPALAQVVTRRVAAARRSAAQTWVNSGTSLGLAVSAPAVLCGAAWRQTWLVFAAVAALVASATVRALQDGVEPDDTEPDDAAPVPARADASTRRWSPSGAAVGLLVASFVLGATSAPYWTFARQRVLEAGLAEAWSVGFWVLLGVSGLLGGSAGVTARRRGLPAAIRWWSVPWLVALTVLALPQVPVVAALVSAGAFGAAFMALTGLGILWAVATWPDATVGVRACFLALGAGQAVATPLAGAVAGAVGLPAAFALAGGASLVLLVVAGRAPASSEVPTGHGEDPGSGAVRPGRNRAVR
ncbi:MFS transporter [Egicoccus halophilus]|uniref:MFS transporter n=1 Tax=Egicoccus halophilus TaxID=1670830 RepID=A0A8J3ABU1_9ACTN|nr:MFS transporter [Egicoccus halophilus]GGI07972.1 MFS transporter [Egicoccus halophilus]